MDVLKNFTHEGTEMQRKSTNSFLLSGQILLEVKKVNPGRSDQSGGGLIANDVT